LPWTEAIHGHSIRIEYGSSDQMEIQLTDDAQNSHYWHHVINVSELPKLQTVALYRDYLVTLVTKDLEDRALGR
jgi:hypothetical protein